MCHAVTQGQGVLQRVAAQVKVAVPCAQFLAAVADILDSERRNVGGVEDIDLVEKDLDVACVHLRVLALALGHAACHLNHELAAQGCDCRCHCFSAVRVSHKLCYAVAVAKVDECHSAHFAYSLDPTGQSHSLPCVCKAKLSTCMCPIHILFVFFLFF